MVKVTQRKAACLVGIGVRHPSSAAPDAAAPIGLLSIRCPNALLWPSIAHMLSSQLQDHYNREEEEDSYSSTTSFSKR